MLEHQGAAYIEGADCFAGALPFYFNRIGGKVNGEKVSRRKRHNPQKAVTRGGKQYTYWEARYTVGRDPGTGKQVQRSITGKTQKEVAQKLKAATAAIDTGTYITPAKMTVGSWLDVWAAEYLGSVKPATATKYRSLIKKAHQSRPSVRCLSLISAHT